jgi:hypothetical protein
MGHSLLPDLTPLRASRGFRLLFAVWPLFALVAVMKGVTALQRPSLDASVPRLVARDDLTAASAVMSMSQNANFVLGSALGGALAVTESGRPCARSAPAWSPTSRARGSRSCPEVSPALP